jgi:hypothetical protein
MLAMTGLGRREVVGAGLGAGLIALTGVKGAQAQTAPSTSGLLRVVATINGTATEYRQENGVDLGDFVSAIGGFTQRCIRVDAPNTPLSVFFRPDRTSDRVEVVFELGRMWTGTPAHLGAYSVSIFRDAQLLATVAAPAHYWHARWRWQSAPRPVVGDVAALIQQNLLPPYDRSAVAPPPQAPPPAHPFQIPSSTASSGGAWVDLDVLAQIGAGDYSHVGSLVITALMSSVSPAAITASSTTAPPIGPAAVYTIMGLAGLTAYMPQTGERPDIGLITEPQAQYVCTAAQSALDTLRAQGEAGGTMPWHKRDERTGAPLDFRTYPKASWYPDSAVGSPYFKPLSCPVTLDSAHMPGLAYLPYLLTGDPYHLEDLQFQANWNWGWYNPDYRPSIPQARQFAWNLRTLAQVAKVTPASVPAWLLPQAHWTAQLTTWQQFFETNFVNGVRAERSIFRCCTPIDSSGDQGPTSPRATWVSMWEDEFVAAVLGWVVSMGFTGWQTAFDWKIGSTIARTGGNSGWPRAQATPYRSILRATATSPFATTWLEAWTLTQSVTKVLVTDVNTWYSSDMTYLTYTRGALAYANKIGTPGANDGLTWATAQLKAKNWPTDYKWRIGSGL